MAPNDSVGVTVVVNPVERLSRLEIGFPTDRGKVFVLLRNVGRAASIRARLIERNYKLTVPVGSKVEWSDFEEALIRGH